MQTSVRKVGNSAGMTIPAVLLKSQGLAIGDSLDIEEHDGYIVLKKACSRPKYTLNQLLSECDKSASVSDEVKEWDAINSVGKEIW